MNNYEFYVLSGNTIVAKWENKTLKVFNENLLPLYLKHNPNAEHWIASRAIDSRRANARLLKKALLSLQTPRDSGCQAVNTSAGLSHLP